MSCEAVRLVARVSRLESELQLERHRRRQLEAKAAGLRSVIIRLQRQLQAIEPKPANGETHAHLTA